MAGAGETTKYPPSEFSQKYAKVLAPDGKLISPDEVFGEGKRFDKDVEEKTRLAFKVTLKKLEKMNIVSEKNKANLELERIDCHGDIVTPERSTLWTWRHVATLS